MGLSDALDDIGKGIKAAADKSGATSYYHGLDTAWDATGGVAASAIGHDVLKPTWEHAIKPALEGLAYGGNVAREALATDILMATGQGNPLSQSSWAQEQKIARQTSLGEVIGYTGARASRAIGNAIGVDPKLINEITPLGFFGATDFATDPNFSLSNPEDVKKFHHGTAKFWTGSTDAVADMFIDPTIGLGKVAKVVRVAAVTRPLNLGQDVEANTTKLDHILGAADGSSAANKRMDLVEKHYMGTAEAPIGEAQRRVMLLRNPQMTHNPSIPEFLARATDGTDFRLRMRVAMNPNGLNVRMLEQSSDMAFQDLQDVQSKVVHGLSEPLSGPEGLTIGEAIKWGDPELIARAEAQLGGKDPVFYQLKNSLLNSISKNDEALLAHQVAENPILNVPRVSLGDKIGSAYRDSHLGGAGNEWYVYQPTRYSVVRVLRSAVTQRPGNIDHDDPNSAIRNITNMFQRAGHGLGAGVSQDIVNYHIGQVSAAATTRNAAALQRTIRAAEKAVVDHNAGLLGVKPEVAERLYQGFADRRSQTIKTLMATRQGRGADARPTDAAGQPIGGVKPPEAAFSGAKIGPEPDVATRGLAYASSEDKRIFADQIVAADNTLMSMPLSLAQMVNSTPLLDLDVMTRFMQRERYALTEHPEAVVHAFAGGLGEEAEAADMAAEQVTRYRSKMPTPPAQPGDALDTFTAKFSERYLTKNAPLAQGADIGRDLLAKFNRVWKPAQLLRLGWPVRVLADEALRTIAINGVLTQGALSLESLGSAAQHGVFRYRLKDLATRGQRKLAEAALPEYRAKFREGIEHASTVDQLAALVELQGRMDVERAATRGELDQVLRESPGRPVYFTGSAGARLGGRARGTLYHLDHSDEALPEGAVTHVRRIDDTDPSKIHTVRHGDADLGQAYLRDTLRPNQYQDLMAMGRTELRAHITNALSSAPDATGRRILAPGVRLPLNATHADLMSMYGVAKARAAGLHSIERPGHSVLSIDDRAISKLDPRESELVDKLAQMHDEGRDLAALHGKLTKTRDKLTEWTEDEANAYEGLISRAAKPSATKRGSAERPLPFSGKSTLTAGHFTIDMNDALGGHHGPMWADLLSAKSVTRAQFGASERSLARLRVAGGDTTTMTAVIPNDVDVATQKLIRETYNEGWERAVNDQIGSDAMLRRITEGQDDDQVLQWLRNTPSGAEHMRKAPEARQQRPEEWVRNARTHIENYLPDPALKQLALDGRATAENLREYGRAHGLTDAQLPVIHAQSLDQLRADSPLMHSISQFTDAWYQRLGTAPTDTLNRQPYFASVYNKERQRRFEESVRGMDPSEHVTDDMVNNIEQRSRETALREVRRTLYDLTQESNLAHTTRFLLPFYSAWQEAMTVWSRLFMDDPSRLARVMAVWNAPQRSGDTYTDADGNKFYVTPVPKFMRGHLGIPDTGIGMPVHVMRDLVFQGNQFWNPGFGPPVMMPLGWFERTMPSTEEFLKPLLPYGPGEGISSQLFPSAYKAALAQHQGSRDSEAYAKGLFRNFQDVYTDNRLGKNDLDEQGMYNEAKRRTDSLFTLKSVTALGLPFAANIRGPYQYYIDKWRTMQEAQRKNPTAFGTDKDGKPITAQDEFIRTEGEDYYVFTLAASKSNIGGIAPTQEGLKGFEQYKDLVAQMPEMGSLIVGDTSGDYSPAVAEWMQNNAIGPGNTSTLRSLRDPKAALHDAEVSRGWTLYRQVATAVDTELHSLGLLSLRAKGASVIAQKRTLLVNKIKADYPAWAQEFGTFDRAKSDRRVAFMNKLVDDPRTDGRPGFGTLRTYLATRQLLVAELAKRKDGGGSNDLQARQNSRLADAWTTYVNQLRQSDTVFAELQTRWLSGDDLKTGGNSQA